MDSQRRSEKRGRSADPVAVNAIDAVFMGAGAPVHESYTIEHRPEATLVWSGPVECVWAPITVPALPEALAALAGASNDQLLEWARANGAFGVQMASPFGEPLDAIREELGQLARTRRLLRLLRDRPGDAELEEAAREAAGHLVDAGLIAQATPIRSVRGVDAPLSRSARLDIQSLHNLGTAIEQGLRRRVLVAGVVTGDRQDMRLQAALMAVSPLAAAYLRTLAEAATLRIGIRAGSRRLDWRQPRACERCGTVFVPKRENQRWHNETCRWAGSKAEQRAKGAGA